MKTSPKRSILINGRNTSVCLEDAFWAGLKSIAHAHRMTLSELVSKIDGTREQANLSSALRLCVLKHFRDLFVLQHLPIAVEGTDVATAHLSPGAAETKTDLPVPPASQLSSIE
jgi:predicted DNA-binding ribbon-helix-helix protein